MTSSTSFHERGFTASFKGQPCICCKSFEGHIAPEREAEVQKSFDMGCACFRSQPPPPERVQVIRQSVSPTLPEPVEPRPPSPTTALEPITLTEEPAAGKEDRKPYVLVKLPNRAAVEITRSFFQRPDNELLDSCMSSKILNDKAEFQPGTDVLWFDVYKKTHQHALIRYIGDLFAAWLSR